MTVTLDRILQLPTDPAVSIRAQGRLAPFAAAGVLSTSDVQTAATLLTLAQPGPLSESDELVRLAAAFCVRGLRHGSVATTIEGLALTEATTEDGQAVPDLPWPDAATWLAACRDHPAVTTGTNGSDDRPLRLDGGRLYLQKYWHQESAILTQVLRRLTATDPSVADPAATAAVLRRLFPGAAPDRQRLAAATALVGRFAILAGGPGTGKTTTIARVLAALRETWGGDPHIALAAPTGKAAARMQDATNHALDLIYPAGDPRAFTVRAATLHRLLRATADPSRPFRHDRYNPLPYDVVVVDECSMVDVSMMDRLLDAVRPDARLLLVGDPEQLASIDAGAVLGDLVAVDAAPSPARAAAIAELAPGDPVDEVTGCAVVTLTHGWRFEGAIAQLAAAVTSGDSAAALDLLRSQDPDLEFIEVADAVGPHDLGSLRRDVVDAARAVQAAAEEGDAVAALDALDRHRLLCAHREGPHGVAHWNSVIASWVADETAAAVSDGEWQVGRGLIITANDYSLGLYNGDAGVIVAGPNGTTLAAFARPDEPLLIPPVRLDAVTSLDAMTIHRGQGSQFATITVILPDPDSPLLTRELLYTAITRAQQRVRLIGSSEAVAAAIGRRVVRASGLRERLATALSAG